MPRMSSQALRRLEAHNASPEQAVDIATLYDVNQDHEIVLREALVVNQMQAMKKEYQLGLKKYSMHKKNPRRASNLSSTR